MGSIYVCSIWQICFWQRLRGRGLLAARLALTSPTAATRAGKAVYFFLQNYMSTSQWPLLPSATVQSTHEKTAPQSYFVFRSRALRICPGHRNFLPHGRRSTPSKNRNFRHYYHEYFNLRRASGAIR